MLAIVSVAVFSIVLCDQIESRLAFVAAQSAAPITPAPPLRASLLDQVAEVAKLFVETYPFPRNVSEATGALAGFVSAEPRDRPVKVSQDVSVEDGIEVDVIVRQESGETIAIELRTARSSEALATKMVLSKLRRIVSTGHLSGGVGLVLPNSYPSADAKQYRISVPHDDKEILIVSPWVPPQQVDHS